MSNILKQYRVAGEDKNVRVINSNSMIKQIFADSISRPADSYTGISSDAQSSLEKTKSLSPDTQESGFNDGINAAVVTEIDVSAEKERLLEEAKLEADSILDKAKAEASRLLDEAKQRAQILYADNKSKGYEDGLAECQREFDEKEISLRQELSDKESALKSKDEFDESGPEPVMDAAHNSHYAQPEEIVTQEELKTMLVKSLDNLTEKERRVIELYYYEDLTLKEISNILEVSESRVSQLHTKGLIKMRKVMGPYMNILTNA